MQLIHKANQKVISKDLKVCSTLTDQLFGLLRSTNPRTLLFRTRFGIHTFGLKESIDVVVLDSVNQVVGFKKNLSPWSLFFWNPKYSCVIELPSGTVESFNIKIGDKLNLSKRI